MKTELAEISPLLRKTIIKKEDKYFYSHPGMNPLAVVRAIFKNIFACDGHLARAPSRCKWQEFSNRAKGISGVR